MLLLAFLSACRQTEDVVRIAVTTDVHGMIFPYDFSAREPSDHSLSQLHTYTLGQRIKKDTVFLLLDNGDFLQGQPTVYYYNYMDTTSIHLSARVMNFLDYDAGTVGNHDIEAGPDVYFRTGEAMEFPWLAANAVYRSTGAQVFEPYTVLNAGEKRIAVLGLITPGIPKWLPESLWPGMEFRDMVETAREWVPVILEKEQPDLLVGLFHSGTDAGYGGNPDPYLNENASQLVAQQVPGFHLVFAGHDHRVSIQWIENVAGDSVLLVDPGSHARFAGEVTITFNNGKPPRLEARNVPMSGFASSGAFESAFRDERTVVEDYLSDTITLLTRPILAADALFGPSALTSLVHRVQLEETGAHISFTAPLSLRTVFEPGPLLVSDMFSLYRYENMLYAMELSGGEIDGFLEHAASGWFNTMQGPGDPLLLFDESDPDRLENPYYNFSSAAGIDYTIDVSMPPGDRITIHSFSDGRSFREEENYLVAVNSYRGNGGGGHLTEGAGIGREELKDRIRWASDTDIRLAVMQYLQRHNTYEAGIIRNWKCVPAEWTDGASERDARRFY